MGITDTVGKRMSNPKGRLQWYLDLLNTDIDSLPKLDAFAIFYGLKAVTYGDNILYDDDISGFTEDTQERRNEVKEIQDLLKDVLEGILACRNKMPLIKDKGMRITDIANFMKRCYVGKYEMEVHIIVQGGKVKIEPSEEKYIILLKFMSDLSFFTINSIKRCERPDCKKYFLKGGIKEKRYCSNKCAWVMNARKRREVNSNT